MTHVSRSDTYGAGWMPIRCGSCVEIRMADTYIAVDENDDGEITLTAGTVESEATVALPPSIAAYVAGLLATQAGVKFE